MPNEIALLNPDEILGRGEYADKTAEDFLREDMPSQSSEAAAAPLGPVAPALVSRQFSYETWLTVLLIFLMAVGAGYYWWRTKK